LEVTDRQILKFIAANAKRARLKAGLTQECVAELAGVHWQTISHLEQGRAPYSVTSFIRLCLALEINPDDLIDGLPQPDLARFTKIKKAMARKRQPVR
jgi:transcriptional regulator with XRE-family HTH domain